MKIRACEVVQEDIEDIRANDGDLLSDAEDDIVKRSQSSSSQISQMTILMDEDQIVSDYDETEEKIEEKFEETVEETVEENAEAKNEANIGNAGKDKSFDTEKHAEDEVLDVNTETENDIDEDCEPEVNNEVVEEDYELENRNDLNVQSSSSQISQMTIILDEDQIVSDNDETEEKNEETIEKKAEENTEKANIENASEDKYSDTEKHPEDVNTETEIVIDEDREPEINDDFNATKALQEALDNDDSEEIEEVHEESAEELVDDEDDIGERVIEIDADFSENNDEDKTLSEISNEETKAASTIEDSGRDSFPPTENSSSNQQEGAEEEATMYDFDEDCEEFEKQRIISIFFSKLIFSISG